MKTKGNLVGAKAETQTKFDKFVRDFGVDALAERLGVHSSAVWHWIDGSTSPHPVNAIMISMLARERGLSLTLEEIYQHFQDIGSRLYRASSLKPKPARA